MQNNEEARKLRDRYRELAGRADRLAVKGQAGVSRFVGKVYDGGAIPTSVPKVFLTHPATIFSPDTEGGTATATVDTSQSIPVWVLGPGVPVANDYVIARGVNYRYAADFPGSSRPRTLNVTAYYKPPALGGVEGATGATITLSDPDNWWEGVGFLAFQSVTDACTGITTPGVPITFRLTDNLDGTYSLSYRMGMRTNCISGQCAWNGTGTDIVGTDRYTLHCDGTTTSTVLSPFHVQGTFPTTFNEGFGMCPGGTPYPHAAPLLTDVFLWSVVP